MRHAVLSILTALVLVSVAADAEARTITVQSESGFHKAVKTMRGSNGTVVLRRGTYGSLTVGERYRGWLTIRAKPGVTVHYLSLRHTQRVRVQRLRVRGGILNVHSSSNVVLDRVRIVRARASLAGAHRVSIRRSTFTLCGENREACLGTGWGSWASSNVVITDSRFHDCYGCDFIRGHVANSFVLRSSTLERAVPGPCGVAWECNHQDGVQISHGRNILIEGNRFGLTAVGAGQLYFSKTIDGLTIRNNVFFGTDARLPDWAGWAAIIVGNHVVEDEFPRRVSIANNTILTGSARPDGLANSVFLSPSYANIPVEERPTVTNNVLGLLRNPERLCTLGGVVTHNIVRDADTPCTATGAVGDPGVDERGYPVEGSILIDRADPAWATPTDLRGWQRDVAPDIGAYEFNAAR